MSIFEEGFRTIRTRGITLTQEQMDNFRIRRVFNSIGDPDYLNGDDAEQMLMNHIVSGDFCLLEVAEDKKLFIISLITFEDIWSRNVFALKNMDYYYGFPDLITLYN